MFAAESATVRVSASPVFAATLVALHIAAAVAPALAGLPWPMAAPVAGAILYHGWRRVRRDALRQGAMDVRRVEVLADGRVYLRTGAGREAWARLGRDTWVTPWFIVLDLEASGSALPRGLVLGRGDAAGFRRLAVLLRWRLAGAGTTHGAASLPPGSP